MASSGISLELLPANQRDKLRLTVRPGAPGEVNFPPIDLKQLRNKDGFIEEASEQSSVEDMKNDTEPPPVAKRPPSARRVKPDPPPPRVIKECAGVDGAMIAQSFPLIDPTVEYVDKATHE